MSADKDDGMELARAAVATRLGQLISVVQVLCNRKDMAEVALVGRPDYLPDNHQLLVDLMDWASRASAATPEQVRAATAPKRCSCGNPATTMDPFGGSDVCGTCGRQFWVEWAEHGEREGFRRYRLLDEHGQPGELEGEIDLDDFVMDNEIEGEDLKRLYLMKVGSGIVFGGGAAPTYTIERVA